MIFNKSIFIALFFSLLSCLSYSEPLTKESPEYKQLQAMGYDIKDNGKFWSLATADNNKLSISKNVDRTTIATYYTRKKSLTAEQELALLRIVNKLNVEYLYQFALTDNSLSCAVYLYGQHDPKTFSKLVRYMENLDSTIDKYPEIYKLIN